ncbi:hypothetical protein TWF281_006473 [Arthrobotrys megalospora]
MDRFSGASFGHGIGSWSLGGFMSGAVAGLVPAWSSPIFGVVAALACNGWIRLVHWTKRQYRSGISANGAAGSSSPWRIETIISWFVQRYDDPFDVFAIHAVGGLVGLFLTGIFARNDIVALDPLAVIDPSGMGVIDGNAKRLGYQVVDGLACFSWSFFITLAILLIMNKIPGLHLRYQDATNSNSLDTYELGKVEALTNLQLQPVLNIPTDRSSTDQHSV